MAMTTYIYIIYNYYQERCERWLKKSSCISQSMTGTIRYCCLLFGGGTEFQVPARQKEAEGKRKGGPESTVGIGILVQSFAIPCNTLSIIHS
jgi:hypothetical protein